ncbi:MAG: LCP family protein [Ktedonobacterales bacterium]
MPEPLEYRNGPQEWDTPTLPLGSHPDRLSPPLTDAVNAANMPTLPAARGRPAAPRMGSSASPIAPQRTSYLPHQQMPARQRQQWGGYPPAGHPRWRRVLRMVVLLAVVLLVVLLSTAGVRAYAFGKAISAQSPLGTQTGYMSGAGRVNVVVLGYGGAGHDGANLTDSLMVMSMVPGDHATTLISVPRDLWVQVPPGSGQYAKINVAYQDGLNSGFGGLPAGREAGGAEAAQKVSDVLGIDVPYWLTIDFHGFRELVDALGGVDINVPTAFTARYPNNDDAAVDPSWKTIHFNTGMQHMNGEQAIEYARARYVLQPLSEGTDFARSARQQILIRAILSRARQPGAWPGITGATDALQRSLYTNLSLADLALFAQKLDLTTAQRVGLQDVLVDGRSGDGQDILLPTNGDWNAIKQYISSHLKS